MAEILPRGVPESEARALWCPLVRAAWAEPYAETGWRTTSGPVGFNRALVRPGNGDKPIGRCAGSGCMFWRTTGFARLPDVHRLEGLTRLVSTSHVERVGHCGQAGPPGLDDRALGLVDDIPRGATWTPDGIVSRPTGGEKP